MQSKFTETNKTKNNAYKGEGGTRCSGLGPAFGIDALSQSTLKKLHTLKKISKCVKFWINLTHFEKKIQIALNLGPT